MYVDKYQTYILGYLLTICTWISICEICPSFFAVLDNVCIKINSVKMIFQDKEMHNHSITTFFCIKKTIAQQMQS